MSSHKLRAVLFLGACLLVNACASSGYSSSSIGTGKNVGLVEKDLTPASAESDRVNNAHIAALLVGTLAQLPGFEPLAFTVQVTPAVTEFGSAIVQQFRKAGYGIQQVAEDQGRNYVSYARTEIISDLGFIIEYSVAVRDVIILRKFAVTNEGVQPISPTVIIGAKPQNIHLNHDAFKPLSTDVAYPRSVVFELDDGEQVSFLLDDNASITPMTRASSVSSLIGLNTAYTIDVNDYMSIREAVVDFPTADSKILGEPNKQLIRRFVGDFTPDKDLIMLAGCFGNQSSADGTSSQFGQSLSWQNRVKYELISAGVDKKRIRVNACSEQTEDGDISGRSVILTLRRLKNK